MGRELRRIHVIRQVLEKRLTHHERALDFHSITARPVSVAEVKPLPHAHRPVTSTPNHPWRQRWWQERESHPAADGTETGHF
ncbi:MAG: hypothetical protein P0121_15295 [Nitrospira sp.]|nr:hypothetical protein [Nitrospira sp.]